MSEQESLLDLDDVENLSLDAIDDLPEFVIPPDGLYVFATKTAKITKTQDKKTGGEKKRINHTYSIAKVIQIADPNELVPPLGSLVGENFTFNQMGLEIWKTKIKGILGTELIKGLSIAEALSEVSQNTYTFVGKTRIKKGSNDAGQEFENVQIQVIRAATDEDLEDAKLPE
jgi:hypothetical protein